MAGLTGKNINLYFDDMGKVLFKTGIVISESLIFIEIKTSKGIEAIPTNKIVRCEVLE